MRGVLQKTCIFILISVLLTITSLGVASAADWNVTPGESIQDTLNIVNDHDTVVVKDNGGSGATYTENIILNKNISLIANGNVTLSAFNPSESVVTINSAASGSIISGFIIKGATGSNGILLNADNCQIVNNTIHSNDLGIRVSSNSGTKIIGNNLYKNNIGIYSNAGTLNASFNRIVDNKNYGIVTNGGIVNAENNWWGTTNKTIIDQQINGLNVDFDPYLILTVSASPSGVPVNGNSQIKADLTHNSDNQDTSSSGYWVPNGIITNFKTDDFGTINSNCPVTVNGITNTTYNARTTPGNSTVTATVDNEIQNTTVTIGNVSINLFNYNSLGQYTNWSVGHTVGYIADVLNNGPNDATNVIIQYKLLDGIEYLSCSPRGGVGTANYDDTTKTITWIIPYMPAGGRAWMDISTRITLSGRLYTNLTLTHVDQYNSITAISKSLRITANPSADIQVTQNINNTQPQLGEEITITITTTNNGPDTATGIETIYKLPSGLTLRTNNPYTTTQGTYDPITGTWNLQDITNGTTATLTIHAIVTQTGTINSSASRNGTTQENWNQFDSNINNNAQTINLYIPTADIQVNQSVDKENPNYLEDVTLTITTRNNGPDNASGVGTTVALPSGLEYVSHTTNKGTYDPSTGVWSIGSVGNQESFILTIIAKVVEACTIENTASKSAEVQYDPVVSNNAQTVTLNVAEAAYVEVTKNVTPTNPNYHDTVTYTITATNQGPDDATGVNINYSLPTGVTLMGSSASRGSYTNGVWTIGDLANGETVTLTLTALINKTGTITDNTLTTTQNQYKYNNTLPNPINFNIAQAAYVEVTKTATPTNPNYHDTITYTITATNQGPDNASGVNINYTIPTGFILTGTSVTRGTYSNGIWTIGDLANGETVTLTLSALINKTGTITDNTLTTTQNQYKYNNTLPNPINFNIPLAADIQVTQSTPTTVNFGDQICVFVTATNNGPDTANNVVVNISLPTGFFYSSHSGGIYNPTTGVWTVSSLLNGTYSTLNIIGTILTTNAFTINSTKTGETEYDYNLTNNNATNTVAINMGNVVSFSDADDGSSSRITLPFTVYLFDRSYTTFYINVNGLVSFGSAMSTYIPDPSINQAFIAPFWDDLYMTGGAAAYYKVDGDVVTITWVKVPSYLERNNPTKFNTFQLRIVREPSTGNTIYAFIYGDMQWKVGYNNGKSFAGFGGDLRSGNHYYHTYTTFWTNSGSLSQLTNQTFWFNHSGVQIAAPAFVDPDIEVTQMVSTDNPARRENFNITVTVTNLGPEPTTGVQITNELPSGLRFVSANTSQGSYDSSTGIWNIGNLEVNETVTLTLTVYAQQRGTYVIRSEKTSQVEYDPNPDNDFSEITVTVT
ncbi:MAG TPA: DUF11 domain-containing protein [Methanobacterium subterraneum]|uniref:DUF11 domain-containing protein n=1 Tax=Methanobacterium subterraneum TaxID=59277 RepID=A0A7J4TIN0_9EURY|nr:DUF11 domain-containing protein [Methanobacterium subterraneum]